MQIINNRFRNIRHYFQASFIKIPGRSISRILSSTALKFTSQATSSLNNRRLGSHLSGIPVSRQLVQPTRNSSEASSLSFLLGLALDGGCLAVRITAHAGGLLHKRLQAISPFHPYRRVANHPLRRSISVARSGRSPRPGRYPASCSVECGLSSQQPKLPRGCPTSLGLHHTILPPFRQFNPSSLTASLSCAILSLKSKLSSLIVKPASICHPNIKEVLPMSSCSTKVGAGAHLLVTER